MENQNVNHQSGNPHPGSPEEVNQANRSPLPPEFVGLPPAQQEQSAEERLVIAERYISELLRGYQMAGQAINRLETHLFSLFKICFDKEIMDWPKFMAAQEGLMKNEDLLTFWQVKEEADKYSAAQEAAMAENEEKENSATSSEQQG